MFSQVIAVLFFTSLFDIILCIAMNIFFYLRILVECSRDKSIQNRKVTTISFSVIYAYNFCYQL